MIEAINIGVLKRPKYSVVDIIVKDGDDLAGVYKCKKRRYAIRLREGVLTEAVNKSQNAFAPSRGSTHSGSPMYRIPCS